MKRVQHENTQVQKHRLDLPLSDRQRRIKILSEVYDGACFCKQVSGF